MKRILIIILALLPLFAWSQLKVTERSEKKLPSWMGASGEGFIQSTGVAKSIDEAKAIAMEDIRKQIIESVALNIKSETDNNINQVSGQGGEIGQFSEEFNSKFATAAVKLPFVKGISPNKIEAYYWEKREDKKSGISEYGYTIRYPFSKGEQMLLIREFEKIDKEMVGKLVGIEAVVDNFTTTEQLDKAMGEIPVLMNYFFDDVRLERTKSARQALVRQYDYIKPMIGITRKGQAYSILTVGERMITTTQKPNIKSNCATQIAYTPEDGQVVIKYNEDGCVDSEDNFIEVSYRFNGKNVKEKAYFDVNSENLQASLQSDLRFDFEMTDVADSLSGVKVSFSLAVNNVGAILESATFTLPNISDPIVIKGCDKDFSGSGIFEVEISNDQSYLLKKQANIDFTLAKAVLYLRNKVNGSLQSVPLTRTFTTNLK